MQHWLLMCHRKQENIAEMAEHHPHCLTLTFKSTALPDLK